MYYWVALFITNAKWNASQYAWSFSLFFEKWEIIVWRQSSHTPNLPWGGNGSNRTDICQTLIQTQSSRDVVGCKHCFGGFLVTRLGHQIYLFHLHLVYIIWISYTTIELEYRAQCARNYPSLPYSSTIKCCSQSWNMYNCCCLNAKLLHTYRLFDAIIPP